MIPPVKYVRTTFQKIFAARAKAWLRPRLPVFYAILIGLLSVSGLRLGEALNLELQDVDLQTAVLTIKSGKFGKSRLVPLHRSTRDVLADYMARRNRFATGRSISSYFFVSSRASTISVTDLLLRRC